MTASCEPGTAPQPREEEQEVVLRLGDILGRVPPEMVKPGTHDVTGKIRFSVDELAEKIARGRVTVPLRRLAAACPGVFRDSAGSAGDEEIQLPLQKLLEQVGLVARKPPAPNGMPPEQLAQARAKAALIIEEASAPLAVAPAEAKLEVKKAPIPAATAETEVPARGAKGVSAMRQILGIFGRGGKEEKRGSGQDRQDGIAERQPVAAMDKGQDGQSGQGGRSGHEEKQAAAVMEKEKEEATIEPAAQTASGGTISLRVLPIFRLLPANVLRVARLPQGDARAEFPLSKIEPQLASGHVEIPIEDFIKALPEELRETLNPIPKTRVWIPLDEIYQNLPADHLFHMPRVEGPAAKVAVAEVETVAEPERPAAEAPAEQVETPADKVEPAKVVEAEPVAVVIAVAAVAEKAPEQTEAPVDKVDEVDKVETEPAPVAASAELAVEAAEEQKAEPVAEAEPVKALEPEPTRVVAAAVTVEEAPPVKEIPAESPPQAAAGPTIATWMHGFQIPPPRLFGAGIVAPAVEAASEEAGPDVAPVPEGKRTADFLASQPGVFAAAVFLQESVFVSEGFPGKPELETLREFVRAFADQAGESGKRLGWMRVVTVACEGYHATAAVRERGFIVALHYDRVLSSVAHEGLIAAADELGPAHSPSPGSGQ